MDAEFKLSLVILTDQQAANLEKAALKLLQLPFSSKKRQHQAANLARHRT